MSEHGNGSYGTKVVYHDGKVNTFWCATESERDSDYRLFRKNRTTSGIDNVKKVHRNV